MCEYDFVLLLSCGFHTHSKKCVSKSVLVTARGQHGRLCVIMITLFVCLPDIAPSASYFVVAAGKISVQRLQWQQCTCFDSKQQVPLLGTRTFWADMI